MAGFMRLRTWKRLYRHQRIIHIHDGSPPLKDSRPDEGMFSSVSSGLNTSADRRQVQCGIFSTIFNPTGERLGNKILRQRLRGPALAAYYPRRVATFKDLQKLYPGFETYNEFEEDRLEHLQIAKSRGKGAPKKKRTAAGEIMRRNQTVSEPRYSVLTVVTQRARSSTARRGNDRILGFETGIHCMEFWDTLYRSWNCTVWPREYPGCERRHLRPTRRQVCMYNTLFIFSHAPMTVATWRTIYC
jgi:small subunit ribosomal protein S33